MSLFGTNHTVTFGSVVYNLAGPEAKRPQYLKTVVAGSIIRSAPLTETIRNSYLNGPGIGLRSFAKWSERSGYSAAISQSGSSLTLAQSVDLDALTLLMPGLVTVGSDQTVNIQVCTIDLADFTHWADQYVALNYPAAIGTAYTAAFDQTSNVITVTFVDTTTVSFTPVGYDPTGRYLYAAYSLISGGSAGSITTGTTITAAMPSVVGWTSDTSSDPDVTVWEMTTYDGVTLGGDSTTSTRQIMYQNTTAGTYRIDTQTIIGRTISDINVLIYQYGSGNSSVDALFKTTSSNGDFFPYIPIRVNSSFVSPTYLGDLYTQGKKALKKSINGNLDKLISDIGANPSIGNIFNAYVVFGVSLNVTENSCRKYIYKFFQEIMVGADLSNATWKTDWDAANALMATWQAWSTAQSDPLDPLFSTAEPVLTAYPVAPATNIVVGDSGAGLNYTSTISFTGINETTGSGLLIPSATPGKIWLEIIDSAPPQSTLYTRFSSFPGAAIGGQLRINWQVDATHWRYLDVFGLTHTQQLFRDKVVVIGAAEALAADENGSGFIIPLHQGIFSSMPLVDATQMSTACAFVVFTTEVVTKSNWYESGLFKILLIIVIIIIVVVVTYLTYGADLAAVPGLLGTAGSVGGAVGLTGTAAALAGLVINAIAAMVLTEIITRVSTALLGPKLGSLVGAIASFVLLAGTTSYMSGVDLAANFAGMTLVSNLAQLTVAVGNGFAQYMQASAQETLGKIPGIEAAYKDDSLQITQQSEALFGSNNGLIDPLMFTDMAQAGPTSPRTQTSASLMPSVEAPEVFLTRTLMTGSDLAGLSMDMLTGFSDITLNTELPI